MHIIVTGTHVRRTYPAYLNLFNWGALPLGTSKTPSDKLLTRP